MRSIKRIIALLLVLALLVSVVIISSLNSEKIFLNLHFLEFEQSLGLIIVVTLISGIIVGLLLSSILWVWPLKRHNSQLKRKHTRDIKLVATDD